MWTRAILKLGERYSPYYSRKKCSLSLLILKTTVSSNLVPLGRSTPEYLYSVVSAHCIQFILGKAAKALRIGRELEARRLLTNLI